MKAPKWWLRVRRRPVADSLAGDPIDERRPDLREFVYLDEVSLRSLLSSQKGGVTDSTSEQATRSAEAELSASVGAEIPTVAKGDFKSRYQTSNSSTNQTSRKSTVQSWFRELHDIKGLRLIEPVTVSRPAGTLQDLANESNPSLVSSPGRLQRGKLVEFRVRLSADPVFHLGTMVSEFTGMADDYPEMFAADNALASLRELQPINKILQRLLAGLIPIRAEAVDYVVAEVSGAEYVVHRELLRGFGIATRPLQIVGVTEHLAYWKDIRRVLFSNAEFTVLCRIARPGLHDSWTPVKLADLFREVTPRLVDQINAAGRLPLGSTTGDRVEGTNEARLSLALRIYAEAVLADLGTELTPEQTQLLDMLVQRAKSSALTVSGQRLAFAEVTDRLMEFTGKRPEAHRALQLRELARQNSGLSLFPALTTTVATPAPDPVDEGIAPRLLDVDVVAIYW